MNREVRAKAEGCSFEIDLDYALDPAGAMAVVKAVRFRVDFHGTSHVQTVVGYTTALTLTLEKGALSSFKEVFNRLRRDWDLDVPRTPGGRKLSPPILSPALSTDGRFPEVVYSDY